MANFNIDYLVVAGGGAGGGSALGNFAGGGGGAGGVRTSFTPVSTPANYTILPTITSSTGTSYSITVGAGGAGVASASTKGGSGANSIFDTIATATGGGGGGVGQNDPGLTGGSAGGTAPTTTTRTSSVSPTQGFRGGGAGTGSNYGSGGGGGGGAEGVQGTNSKGGNGGIGFQTAITGANTYYAGGGGGGSYKPPSGATSEMGLGGLGGGGSALVRSVGEPGTNGLGGGGGAATNGDGEGGNRAGGNGGSGVVILRYATADANYTTTGITPTEDTTTIPGQTILSFTTVGTGTITFTPPPPPLTPFDGTKVTNPVTGFNKTGTSEGLKLPSGDNSNQPAGALAEQGMIRNDTEETVDNSASAIAHYNGAVWKYFAATESPDFVYPTSLKMYLDASDTTSYPGTGTTWFDLTSNANNGIINGATFSPSNASFDFNGSSDYISFSQFNISSNNKVTVELWTNPDSSQVTYANMFDYGHDSTNGFTVQQSASSTNNYYIWNTGSLATNNIPANTWTQFCFTGDGQNWKIYKNGALVSTATSSGSANTTGRTLNIGRWLAGTARYWNGQISKVRIYDTPLSGIEVTALYNEGR